MTTERLTDAHFTLVPTEEVTDRQISARTRFATMARRTCSPRQLATLEPYYDTWWPATAGSFAGPRGGEHRLHRLLHSPATPETLRAVAAEFNDLAECTCPAPYATEEAPLAELCPVHGTEEIG